MRSHALTLAGLRLARWRNRRNVQAAGFWAMVALGPLLALATFARARARWSGWARAAALRLVLLLDFVYALVGRGLRGAAHRRDDRGAAAALGGLAAAPAAGALLHR